MAKPHRITILLSDEALAKCEREAVDAGWTVEQFVAWLAESYEPPQEVEGLADDGAPL